MHLFDAFSYFQFEEFSQPQDDWLWNEIKFLVVSLQEEDSLRSASQPQEDPAGRTTATITVSVTVVSTSLTRSVSGFRWTLVILEAAK